MSTKPVALCGDESQAMDDLWRWVYEMGGSGPKVKLAETCARTVVTSDDVHGTVKEGENIFSIPIKCLMHPAVAFEDPQYGAALAALSLEDGVDDRSILVFFLAIERERGASSRWAPYVNSLPAEVPSPLAWSDAELRHLAGTRLEGAVKIHREALRQQSEVYVPSLLARLRKQLDLLVASSSVDVVESRRASEADILEVAKRALTPERVAWSRSCVWSRAFSLYILGIKTTALVPLGDMLDHSPRARVEWRTDDAAGTFSIVSHQTVPAGNTVYNNYGAKSNEELLLGYGFVLEPNTADTLYVQLAANEMLSDSDETHEQNGEARAANEHAAPAMRAALLLKCGLKSSFFLRLDDPLPAALLDAARVYLLSPAAAYACNSDKEGAWDPRDGIDMSGDLCTSFRVLQSLIRLFTSEYDRLRSSLTSVPSSSLQDGSVRSCVVNMAAAYRNSQLKIASAAIDILRERSYHLLLKLEIAEQGRITNNTESCGSFSKDVVLAKENGEFEQPYHTWKTESGVQTLAAEELSASKGSNLLGAGVGGLRITSDVFVGGMLGRVPLRALMVADDTIRLSISDTNVNNSEQVALAATLLIHTKQNTFNRWGPFARWLLSAPTTAAAFDENVLKLLGNTPLGQEADIIRQGYDDELAVLTTAGLLTKSIPDLSDLYARSRAVVERHAFSLPCHCETSQPSVAGRLALAPFVGSLPRKLDDVAGTFHWSLHPEGSAAAEGCWFLELRAACRLRPGLVLITPLDGSDEETRLLEVGSGAASSPPTLPRLATPNDGKTKFPTCSVSAIHHGESSSISLKSNPWHAVEILLEPADEEIELRREKKNVLRDLGLGEAHYLTLPPSPARLCAALAVCGGETISSVVKTRSALLGTSAVHVTTARTSVVDEVCAMGSLSDVNTERTHMSRHVKEDALLFPETSLSFPTVTTSCQRKEDNATPIVESVHTSFTRKVMTSNAGTYKRARKAARTLLRQMLGLLPRGLDTESLWQHARDEAKRGNHQAVCAYVYLAQHRATLENWLEALMMTSPVVESHTRLGNATERSVGKKRKDGGEAE